ncbi:hypothetical protein Salat_2914600 [Sesamum alatum]|uniref:Uncharacterized protein n=1 Tax=Sesamum alatum TaxID=300844 RepID=A0AAE1XIP9_9LAMI|nr:hypothetical protein Salat_2914600 [Sesamum alatum]
MPRGDSRLLFMEIDRLDGWLRVCMGLGCVMLLSIQSTDLSSNLGPGEVDFFEGFIQEPRFQDNEILAKGQRVELPYSPAVFFAVKEKCQDVLFNGVYFDFWWDVPCSGEGGSDGVGVQWLLADDLCNDRIMGGLVWEKGWRGAKSTINGVGSTRNEGGEIDGVAVNAMDLWSPANEGASRCKEKEKHSVHHVEFYFRERIVQRVRK